MQTSLKNSKQVENVEQLPKQNRNESIDSLKLCRICLKMGTDLIDFFDPLPPLNYSAKLTVCFPSIHLSENDSYPKNICTECSQIINQSYEFFLLCQRSEENLEQMITDLTVQFELSDVKIENLDESAEEESEGDPNPKSNKIRIRKHRKHDDCYDDRGKYVRRKRKPTDQCKLCGKMMFGKYALEQHIRKHTGEKPFICEICGRSLQTRGSIKKHIRRHIKNPIKRLQCPKCSFKTDCSYQYKIHSIIHTGELPFSCPECPRRFNSKSNLHTHIKNIHGSPSYSCEICNEKFRSGAKLQRHTIFHYRSANYQCPECRNIYSHHKGLMYHMKLHHPTVKRPSKKDALIDDKTIV